MKKTVLMTSLAAFSAMCLLCGPTSPVQTAPSSAIYFERIGGGANRFTVATTQNSGQLAFSVTRFNYKDTAFAFTVDLYSAGALYESVAAVLNGKTVLSGDFRPSQAPTGTWAIVSAVSLGSDTVEITNTGLRNQLLLLEGFVRNEVFASKRAVLEHLQTVTCRIVQDSTKKSDYPILQVDPIWVFLPAEQIGKMHDSARTGFLNKVSADSKAVVFLSAGYNFRPLGADIGGWQKALEALNLPFAYSATKYNAKDSTLVTLTDISPTGSLTITCGEKVFGLSALDSMQFSDTLLARTDSTWCYQEIVITHTFINHGYDDIMKPGYVGYFW